jgi:AraC family transcriptional regulator
MTIGFVTQQFERVVDWSFSATQPMVLVWRRGDASSKEVGFDQGPAGPVTPRPSTVWVIPADQRSTAQARDDVLARLLRETLAQGLSLHIRDHYGQLPSAPSRARTLDSDEQRLLIEFLHDSLDTDIDIPSLAGLVDMTVHGFRRAFMRTFGVTPYRYVLDQRVQRAKTLLATTTLPITEVSIALGFATPSHFTTMFKQRVGVTPTVYRRNT